MANNKTFSVLAITSDDFIRFYLWFLTILTRLLPSFNKQTRRVRCTAFGHSGLPAQSFQESAMRGIRKLVRATCRSDDNKAADKNPYSCHSPWGIFRHRFLLLTCPRGF